MRRDAIPEIIFGDVYDAFPSCHVSSALSVCLTQALQRGETEEQNLGTAIENQCSEAVEDFEGVRKIEIGHMSFWDRGSTRR